MGEKTAARLITTYGDLDNVYAHLDELTPRLREALIAGEEAVRSNAMAIPLVRDLDVSLDPTTPLSAAGTWLSCGGCSSSSSSGPSGTAWSTPRATGKADVGSRCRLAGQQLAVSVERLDSADDAAPPSPRMGAREATALAARRFLGGAGRAFDVAGPGLRRGQHWMAAGAGRCQTRTATAPGLVARPGLARRNASVGEALAACSGRTGPRCPLTTPRPS